MFKNSDKVKRYFLTVITIAIICSGCDQLGVTPANKPLPGIDANLPVNSLIAFEPDKAINNLEDKTIYMKKSDLLSNADNLVLEIRAKEVADLFGLAFQINFDSSLLTYKETFPGELLGSNVNDVFYQAAMEEGSNNKLLFGVTRKRGAGGAGGSGTIALIKFTRKSTGDGAISFANNQAMKVGNITVSDLVWNGGKVKISG